MVVENLGLRQSKGMINYNLADPLAAASALSAISSVKSQYRHRPAYEKLLLPFTFR